MKKHEISMRITDDDVDRGHVTFIDDHESAAGFPWISFIN
jgi:hypothetical protein